jgi:tripartite-type tricarboxylate transporter receptor subunit TctC
MSAERNPHYLEVPTLTEAMHIDVNVGAWRGIAAPKGVPPFVAQILSAALKTAFNSSDFKEFMAGRGFGMTFADAEDFETLMDESDRQMVQAMQVAGIARR